MNKEQFINTILTNKVRRITMFQFPDYNGGFDVEAFFNLTDEKVEDILRSPFTYIVNDMDASDAVRNRNKVIVVAYKEPFHECPYEICESIKEIITKELF
jgi:hypothetical protein